MLLVDGDRVKNLELVANADKKFEVFMTDSVIKRNSH